jgi:hypothetical protein
MSERYAGSRCSGRGSVRYVVAVMRRLVHARQRAAPALRLDRDDPRILMSL